MPSGLMTLFPMLHNLRAVSIEGFLWLNSILGQVALLKIFKIFDNKKQPVANSINFFTAVITPLAAHFSMILTELRRQQCNYDRKKFYNIGHRSQLLRGGQLLGFIYTGDWSCQKRRGRIFTHVQPFYECAVSNLDPKRSMHRPVQVAHSSFIRGSHMTKNMAAGHCSKLCIMV